MAADSLSVLLSTLTSSLTSATSSLPEGSTLVPPADGISLLDTKNELLLSYLHNLVFLILLKLKDSTAASSTSSTLSSDATQEDDRGNTKIQHAVVSKLVELRVYLEKGVKPLENRLKYQIDKVVQAATDASTPAPPSSKTARISKINESTGSQTSDSGSEDEIPVPAISDLSHRPNPLSLLPPSRSHTISTSTSKPPTLYQPPRITPTAPPTSTKPHRKPLPSATLTEYLATEHSTAPVPEPSIGTTIAASGRRNKSAKEREGEREKRDYEEGNYTRLPTEGKKKGKRERTGGWGGEDWRGLGEGASRVEKLVGGRRESALEKSRKRGRGDGGGSDAIGERWEKRRKQERKGRKR